MEPITFKQSFQIKLESIITDYIIKKCEYSSMSAKLKQFFSDLHFYRTKLSNLGEITASSDEILKTIPIQIKYLSQLNVIKQKISFDNNSWSVKINFFWSDTLERKIYSSYNIEFEYYNSLFNLATMYFLVAFNTKKCNQLNENKEFLAKIAQTYSYAFGIFEMINKENKMIPNENKPYDLDPKYMEYCAVLCKIYGQIELLKLAQLKKAKKETQAKLYYGLSQLYHEVNSLCSNAPLEKFADEKFKEFFSNRIIYNEAMMYFKLAEASEESFNSKGEEYGKMIVYKEKGVQMLRKCLENAESIKPFVNIALLNETIINEETQLSEMINKNQNIYHDDLPDIKDQKYESMLMIKAQIPPEFSREMENPDELIKIELDNVFPKDVKEMINKFKESMIVEIKQVLSENENEESIKEFLKECNLPPNIIDGGTQVIGDISNFTWNKIKEVQAKGGIETLSSKMNEFIKMNDTLEGKVWKAIEALKEEEAEDNNCKSLYGEDWTRTPSSDFSSSAIEKLNHLIKQLKFSKECNYKENKEIINLAPYIKILMLPRETINTKLPGRDPTKIKQVSEEDKELQKEYKAIIELSEKCQSAIKSIYVKFHNDLKDASFFFELVKNKSNDDNFLGKKKEEFEIKFQELRTLSEEVRNKKILLIELSLKTKEKFSLPGEHNAEKQETIDFKKKLEEYCNLYFKKLDKFKAATKFYEQQKEKIDKIIKKVYTYINQRTKGKDELIQSIISSSVINSQDGNNETISQNFDYSQLINSFNQQQNLQGDDNN